MNEDALLLITSKEAVILFFRRLKYIRRAVQMLGQ